MISNALVNRKDINRRFARILDAIDIPQSYYEKAVLRYKSISDWLCRDAAETALYEPRVSVQGSFRLGLVNKPLDPRGEYDLDLVCELVRLVKEGITQEGLKQMLGREIRAYALAHGIEKPPKERKRCWRVDYADVVKFHIDNLPCVPEDANVIASLINLGVEPSLAKTAIALTCNAHPMYRVISADWPTSNPAGFALWFESRFGTVGISKRLLLKESGRYNTIDEVPTYALKTPLQQAIQLLKQHRDVMFRDQHELKPISILITTLAAQAYQGEDDLYEAIMGILQRVPDLVRQESPWVPNPVNSGEDFADKWAARPVLAQNFWYWHQAAIQDFEALVLSGDDDEIRELGESKFAVEFPAENAGRTAAGRATRVAPAVVVERGPKPWGSDAEPAC